MEPQVIFIKEAGIRVVQKNCERCHNYLMQEIELNGKKLKTCRYAAVEEDDDDDDEGDGERLCRDCHKEVPHGMVKSLTSTPYARVPLPESPVPDWLRKAMKKETEK